MLHSCKRILKIVLTLAKRRKILTPNKWVRSISFELVYIVPRWGGGVYAEQEAQPGIFGGILEKYADEFWLLFRVVFAILVFLHGIQKAFLLWGFPAGANSNGLGLLIDVAGWVELISALLIGFGFLTRLGAGAICVTMIIAYFGVHMALSPVWPWPHLYPDPGGFAAHGGEVTILWFIVAGVIGVIGGGKYTLDKVVFKREPL